MSADVAVYTVLKNAMLAGMALADGGSLDVMVAPRPATGGTATTVLATFPMATPAGAVSAGVFTGTQPASQAALATGTAAWARLKEADGTILMDGDCGLEGSGKFCELDALSVASGGPVLLLSLTISLG